MYGRSPHEQLSADHGIEIGAGDGNRTHGSSLGSLGITIIRRPRSRDSMRVTQRPAQYRVALAGPLAARWAQDSNTHRPPSIDRSSPRLQAPFDHSAENMIGAAMKAEAKVREPEIAAPRSRTGATSKFGLSAAQVSVGARNSLSCRGGLNTSTSRVSSSATALCARLRRDHEHFAGMHGHFALPFRPQMKLAARLRVCK